MTTTWLTLDEWHLVIRIPADLPAPAVRKVRRVLADRRFVASVERAVRAAACARQSLKPVRITLTR